MSSETRTDAGRSGAWRITVSEAMPAQEWGVYGPPSPHA